VEVQTFKHTLTWNLDTLERLLQEKELIARDVLLKERELNE
jgi:hypothetical protein